MLSSTTNLSFLRWFISSRKGKPPPKPDVLGADEVIFEDEEPEIAGGVGGAGGAGGAGGGEGAQEDGSGGALEDGSGGALEDGSGGALEDGSGGALEDGSGGGCGDDLLGNGERGFGEFVKGEGDAEGLFGKRVFVAKAGGGGADGRFGGFGA